MAKPKKGQKAEKGLSAPSEKGSPPAPTTTVDRSRDDGNR